MSFFWDTVYVVKHFGVLAQEPPDPRAPRPSRVAGSAGAVINSLGQNIAHVVVYSNVLKTQKSGRTYP